jgi:hypothetical protein
MVMEASVYVSEVLCFILNKFGKCPIKNVKEVMLKFYNGDEIVHAKELLHGELVKINETALPRLSKRQGDNRTARDVDDLFAYITKADEAGMLTLLPTFVAANLDRIPSVKPEEVDLCLLVQRMTRLEAIVSQHEEAICREAGGRAESGPSIINDGVTYVRSDLTCVQLATNIDQRAPNGGVNDVPAVTASDIPEDKSWSGVVAQLAQDTLDEWTPIRRKKKSQTGQAHSRVPIRVRGSKEVTSSTVRTIPRQDVLSAYVGRLHPDTTEEQLSVFLAEEGMKGVVCKKLKAKNGMTYRTAAFYVTCSKDSSSLFYDENCWPVGVELRDWVYKQAS